jgi:hypothetical protein
MPRTYTVGVMDDQERHDYMQTLVDLAQAIEIYASLEQGLARLLQIFLGVNAKQAGIIYFRIVNTRSRSLTLTELFEGERRNHAEKFWESLLKELRILDQQRNEIVHWHMVTEVGEEQVRHHLSPPMFWIRKGESAKYYSEQLHKFIHRCEFVVRTVNMFILYLEGCLDDDSENAQIWRRKFQQPIIYPPGDTHPLSRKPSPQQDAPPPSQA